LKLEPLIGADGEVYRGRAFSAGQWTSIRDFRYPAYLRRTRFK
jgi:hypothetical protein